MKSTPDTPKTGNGLIQLIRMDGSTRQMWVNLIRWRSVTGDHGLPGLIIPEKTESKKLITVYLVWCIATLFICIILKGCYPIFISKSPLFPLTFPWLLTITILGKFWNSLTFLILSKFPSLKPLFTVEQIRWVFGDNWRIIFTNSP